jgi:phospholipase C
MSILPDPRTEPDENPFAFSSSLPVTPTATTKYVLTANGPGGQTSASVTITVTQPQPTVTLTSDQTSIIEGGQATLSWTTANTDNLTITPAVTPITLPNGSAVVKPTTTTTYTATATGPGGTSQPSTVTITVTPLNKVGVTLTASASTISAGQSVTLTWKSQNATSVSIAPTPGNVALTGSTSVTPSATTTFTATATDVNGATATSSVIVNVSPAGDLTSKIKHIIFLVQENRSFDSYFGRLGAYRLARGVTTSPNGDIDAFDPNVSLPDKAQQPLSPFHYATECTENLSPQWNESHIHYDNGKMDGYMQTTLPSSIDPNGHRAMGHYDETDLPYYYELATQFAVGDEVHSPVLTNTIPNRMYLFTGTSFGHTIPDATVSAGQYDQKTIFDLMTENGVSWKYYFQDNSVFLFQFTTWTKNNGAAQANIKNISTLFTALADPNADNLLPSVAFIERATATGFDEHPGENVQKGAAKVKAIIDAVMKSPAWPSTVFILTYDEGGAIYDHVPPITVPAPDNIAPILKPNDRPGDFTLSGFRVPFIVISPWVKKNYVSHVPRDYTSILKLIETRFALPPLTARDAAADPLLDFFDFTTASWLTPPPLPDQPTTGACDNTLETGP